MADGDVIAAIIQDTGEVIEIDQPCIPKQLTQTGLLLPANLPFEKWQSVLERLQGMEFSVMWWLGDCLRYGERAYGEKYAQALDATDYAFQTIADAKWVAGQFEISRSRENLTWSHHGEVAGIQDDAEQSCTRETRSHAERSGRPRSWRSREPGHVRLRRLSAEPCGLARSGSSAALISVARSHACWRGSAASCPSSHQSAGQ